MTRPESESSELLNMFDEFWIHNNLSFLKRYWYTAGEALRGVASAPQTFAEFSGPEQEEDRYIRAVIASHLEHHNYSGVLLSYAAFDEYMTVLARRLGASREAPIWPSDLRDRGVKRYRKYVHQVCRVLEDEVSIDWGFLEDFATLRHAIIHANGNLSHFSERKKLEAVVSRRAPELALKHAGIKLVVTDQFVMRCIASVRATAMALNDLISASARREGVDPPSSERHTA